MEKKFNALKEKDPAVASEDLTKVNQEIQNHLDELINLKDSILSLINLPFHEKRKIEGDKSDSNSIF